MATKCHTCQTVTDLVCHNCQTPICAKHAYYIRHHFYCAICFLRQRNLGIVIGWIAVFGLALIGILSVIFFR